MFSSQAQVYNSLIWADEFNLDQSSELRISLSSSSTEMLSIRKFILKLTYTGAKRSYTSGLEMITSLLSS